MFEGILQPMHLLLILVVALVVFGPKRLPEIGKGLGEAIRGFKNSLNEATSDSVKPTEISKKVDERKTID